MPGKYWSIHPITKELLVNPYTLDGSFQARLSPEDLKLGKTWYLIPAHAVGFADGSEDPPPLDKVKPGEVIYRDTGIWKITSDARQKTWYDKTTADEVEILTLTPPPEVIDVPPPIGMRNPRWLNNEWQDDKVESRKNIEHQLVRLKVLLNEATGFSIEGELRAEITQLEQELNDVRKTSKAPDVSHP